MTNEIIETIMKWIVCIAGISALAGFFVLVPISMIDSLTQKQIGTEQVPCVDNNNHEFANETCIKEITCSWLGLGANKRCKDVGGLK